MKLIIIFASLLLASQALAQEMVWLDVNQTHTLSWNWEQSGSPVRSFVFRCGNYTKVIEDADARSLHFGSLIDEPGQYSGCTLAARNEAGDSAPVLLPAFDYAYSYGALGRTVLELAASVSAAAGVIAVSTRQMLGWLRRREQRAPLLALPEPLTILEKGRPHVYDRA